MPTGFPTRVIAPLSRLVAALLCCGASLHAGEVKLTLPAVLERVMSTDRTVAIADYEVRKAVAEKLRPGLRLNLSLSAGASASVRGGRTRVEEESLTGLLRERRWLYSDSHGQSFGLNLNQPILDFTVRPAQQQSALVEAATRWQLRQRLREVLFEVTAQYLEVLRQSQLVEENVKTLGQTTEQVRLAEGRLAAEEVIESDVLQARVSHEQARRAVMEAEVSRDLAMSRLAVMLDYDPATRFSLSQPGEVKSLPAAAGPAIAIAGQHREEIRVAELTLLSTRVGRDEIKARYLPSVTLQAGADTAIGSDLDRRDGWIAGLSVDIPLWERGQKQLDLRVNGLQIEQDALRIENSRKQIADEVLTAWFAVERLERRLASLAIERKAAEENYKVQQGRYAADEATALEVQTALRDQARVRIEHVSATYSLEVARRDLHNVMATYEAPRIDAAVERLTAPRIPTRKANESPSKK
jgi:outer membrane protein TolC